ncbi:hypothetical protein ES703_65320 [subsurface metagenome]
MDEQVADDIDSKEDFFAEGGDEFDPSNATPLCMKCFKPCNPLQYYCDNCSSNDVINPVASYMPFVRIRFECGFFGNMWRCVWYERDRAVLLRLFCLIYICLSVPVLSLFGIPLLLIGISPRPALKGKEKAALCIVACVFMLLYLLIFALILFDIIFY